MAANLTFGSYDSPVTVGACQSQWIIVSSWGASGDYLSLSLTHSEATDLASAPKSLQPAITHLGILLAHSIVAGREETEYLLIRHQPADVTVAGVFYPTDGYVRILRQDGDVTLVGHGRYAHCYGTWQGQLVARDISDPAPDYEKARAWHLTAVRRSWIGEFSPDGASETSGTGPNL